MSLKLVKKKYEHYLKIDTEINIDSNIEYNIYTVYFINCFTNENYSDWLINQLNLIKDFNSTIYIVATILKDNENKFKDFVLSLYPTVNIECHYENEFEYRGIFKAWELGQFYNKTNDIILYFHSKGVTHHKSYEANRNDNYNIILKDIVKIKEIFSIFPLIDKIGMFSGGCGWIWCNFWYARGSYINRVEKPIKTTRRHYYEDWLGRKVNIGDQNCNYERDNESYYKSTLENCYGFHTDKITIANIGSYFSAADGKFYDVKKY